MAQIVDSGERRNFESGAVRDIQEGKGAEYLLPLDVISEWLDDSVIAGIHLFTTTDDCTYLYCALDTFVNTKLKWSYPQTVLEVSIHFEDGMRKYGERNWEKGIPTHCFIDSALRHYLKYLKGDKDERHDRAFLWNLLCCAWTCKHHPEIDDYRREND